MDIKNDWNRISNDYNRLNTSQSNMKLNYLEINNDNVITGADIVNIGCLCNNHSTNNNLVMTQFWNMPDTIINNVTNAKKIINQYYWTEKQNINNNSVVKKKGGLSCKTNSSNNYAFNDSIKKVMTPNVNFFKNIDVTSYMTDFSKPLQANTAIDLFGYFCPSESGDWSFTIAPSDGKLTFSSLWITSDNAVYDYTNNNTDIFPGDKNTTFTTTLIKGEYYGIRLQFANMTNAPTTNSLLNVKSPSGQLIKGNIDGSELFVTLMNNDGSVYNKQLVYFAFTQNINNLFNCFFIEPPSEKNYQSIKELKVNLPLQLKTLNVPISISYSGNETVTNNNSTPIQIRLPVGVKIEVVKSKWGILKPATTIYYTPLTVPATGHVQAAVNSVVGDANSSEPGKTVNYSLLPYDYPSSKVIQEKHTKEMDLSSDVTDKVKTLVNNNSLQINAPYTDLFGDPTATYMLAENYVKELQVQYTYNSAVDQSAISTPFIYLNNRGLAKIGYVWDGINCESDYTFDTTYNACGMMCTYKIVMDNSGKLCIYDGSNMVTSKDLPTIMKIDIQKCIVNPEWVVNPNNKSFLNVNEKLGTGGVDKLVSPNGKFQLYFSGNQLVFEYCLDPNKSTNVTKVADDTVNLHYTTSENIDLLGYQIYYLYRLNTRGISGQRFMSKTNGSENKLYFVPPFPSSNNILKFDSFETKNSIYPLSFPMDNNPNYTVISQNVTDNSVCSNSCISSPTCDHYFYLTDKKNNNFCLLDNKNIANPVYTNTNISNIQSSSLNKKNYYLNTTCGSLPNKKIQQVSNNIYDDGEVMFGDLAKNAPNLTYYCGLPDYQNISTDIKNIYEKGSESTHGLEYKESLISVITEIIAILSSSSPNIQSVSFTLNELISKLTGHTDVVTILSEVLKLLQNGDKAGALVKLKILQQSMQGGAKKENFTTNDQQFYMNSPHKITDHSNINYLKGMSTTFGGLENTIGDNRMRINNVIGKYVDLSNNMGNDANYKFTGPDSIIPNKYVAKISERPESTMNDAVKRDLEIIAVQQNTLYTVAAIATASLIIMTIFVLK